MAARAVSGGDRPRPAPDGVPRSRQGQAEEAVRPQLRGLPPVLGRGVRVLVLGSFPGAASLAAGQYYAHPRNHFWPLVGAVIGVPLPVLPYRQRLAALRMHGIGLWDAIVACRRRGSLDGAIREAVPAEVGRVRRAAPSLSLVCFNGKTAARSLGIWGDAGYATLALPSSSPAYTRPFAEKLAAWQAIAAFLHERMGDRE
jgi:hypoxanthine-DNA glycosylase